MSYESTLAEAMRTLELARTQIQDEMRAYPTPVSGCDAQYNHLIGQRGAISEAMRALHTPRFVATPRMPDPYCGIESR